MLRFFGIWPPKADKEGGEAGRKGKLHTPRTGYLRLKSRQGTMTLEVSRAPMSSSINYGSERKCSLKGWDVGESIEY